MQKYGLRIGDVGVEFPSAEDRQKALQYFTKGTDVTIHSVGIKFTEGKGSFSVYDRDTKEILTICVKCEGTFLIETCNKRKFPDQRYYSKEWSNEDAFICDACYQKQLKLKELDDAKKIVKEATND